MTLPDRILELLKGRSQHKPLLGDDLLAKTGADPDELNDALDDLQGRGALNRAEITRFDRTFTALWPTGLPPQSASWKQDRDNGKGHSRLVDYNTLQDKKHRDEMRNPPIYIDAPEPTPDPVPAATPTLEEEPIMTRIARPAAIVEPVTQTLTPIKSNRPRNTGINAGRVQSAILAVLRGQGELSVVDIFARLPAEVSTTLGSVGKTLETLAKRGEITASIKFNNARHRRFFQLGEVECAQVECAQVEPLCAELPGNLATLRKFGADDHTADADESRLKPAPTVADESRLKPAPTACAEATPAIRTHTPPHAIRSSNRAHFAFYDDGVMEIFQDDATVSLPPAEVARMVAFLGRISA